MPKASFDGNPTGRVTASMSYRRLALGSFRDVETGRVTASFSAHGPGDT